MLRENMKAVHPKGRAARMRNGTKDRREENAVRLRGDGGLKLLSIMRSGKSQAAPEAFGRAVTPIRAPVLVAGQNYHMPRLARQIGQFVETRTPGRRIEVIVAEHEAGPSRQCVQDGLELCIVAPVAKQPQ